MSQGFADLIVDTVEAGSTPGGLEQAVKDASAIIASGDGAEAAQSQAPSKPTKPDWCPDKFWDAETGTVQAEKLGASYKSLESSHGRMANDLGMQRKLTDEILDIRRHLNNPAPTPATAPTLTADEMLTNPADALDKFLAAREAKHEQETNARLSQVERALAQDRFAQAHPDFSQIGTSPEFQSWLNATPYRARLAAKAAQGDFEAASELLTEYKAVRPAQSQQPNANVEAARAAALEGGGASNEPAQKKSGKIWTRVELMDLQLKRPDIYYDDNFQAQLIPAYLEGRVK